LTEREHRGSIGRSNRDPTLTGVKTRIECELESKSIEVESQTPFLVVDKDINRMEAEIIVRSVD
jgi:hypothetical protein